MYVPEPPVIVKSIDPLSSPKHFILKFPKTDKSKSKVNSAGSLRVYSLTSSQSLLSLIITL